MLLREFHADQFTGRLPSWQRSVNAMRHLDVELPEAQQLNVSLGAVWWARGAKALKFAAGVADEHEVATTAREASEGDRNDRPRAGPGFPHPHQEDASR
jgi:hypothetical protein